MADIPFELIDKIEQNIGRVFLGKPKTIKQALVAVLGDGHLLIEDVPGVGKTLLARAIARSIGGTFHRIQFTPDLLPSDIVGTTIYNTQSGEFTFKPGPVFSNVVLADEVNRTTPRTQSALLEAMSDHQVSVDGQTRKLPAPFIVLATQNPFEFEGTYPLPESQLDRFMMRIKIGYPQRKEEIQLLTNHRHGEPVDELPTAMSLDELIQLREATKEVRFDDELAGYLLDIVEATRRSNDLHVGTSPRGSISLYRAAQAMAVVERRDYVTPDDIKRLAAPVLSHRVIGKSFVQDGERGHAEAVIEELVDGISVPL